MRLDLVLRRTRCLVTVVCYASSALRLNLGKTVPSNIVWGHDLSPNVIKTNVVERFYFFIKKPIGNINFSVGTFFYQETHWNLKPEP